MKYELKLDVTCVKTGDRNMNQKQIYNPVLKKHKKNLKSHVETQNNKLVQLPAKLRVSDVSGDNIFALQDKVVIINQYSVHYSAICIK